MKVRKLDFKITDCSGNDPEHPPQDLLVANQFTTGWQSERFCCFPQTITVELMSGICRMLKIQILLHHYKIPTKIEVSTALDSNSDYTKLGHVSIEDNDKNQYKARELKTIHIDAKASLMKIKLFKCHINPLNLYNQIGIVALNILGAKLDAGQIRDLQSEPTTFQQSQITRGIIERSFADSNTPIDSDLNYSDHDRYMVHALTAVAEKKKHAVQKENYPLAKQLKILQSEFAETSNLIMSLLTEKRAAIKSEDFDTATSIQNRVDGLKVDVATKLRKSGFELHQEGLVLLKDSSKMNSKAYDPQPTVYHDSLSDLSLNDVPIKSKISVENAQKLSRPATTTSFNSPDDLNEQQMEEFALAIKIFGLKAIAAILSLQFNYREEGLNAAIQFLESLKTKTLDFHMDEIVGVAFQLLAVINSDSREKSHGLMCNLYSSVFILCEYKEYPLESMLPFLIDLFPSLLNEAADINPRIRQRSIDLVTTIIEKFHTPDLNILDILVKPYARTNLQSVPWKHVKARLDLVSDTLTRYGLNDAASSQLEKVAWSSKNVLQFTKVLASHNRPEVRDSVVDVIFKVVQLVPSSFESLVDLPRASLDQIRIRASNYNSSKSGEGGIKQPESEEHRESFEQ